MYAARRTASGDRSGGDSSRGGACANAPDGKRKIRSAASRAWNMLVLVRDNSGFGLKWM